MCRLAPLPPARLAGAASRGVPDVKFLMVETIYIFLTIVVEAAIAVNVEFSAKFFWKVL
jgi:hypothetical protein